MGVRVLAKARQYFAGFDPRLMPSMLHSLEYFECCPEVRDALSQLEKERLERDRIAAEAATMPRRSANLSVAEKAEATDAGPSYSKAEKPQIPELR
ncbi:unnamed protein product, partial [marine sediment metagenome]